MRRYVAPEILEAGRQEGYRPLVDMFSVGVVAYILLCAYEPFFGDTDRSLVENNKSAAFQFHSPDWDAVSSDAKHFIRALLDRRRVSGSSTTMSLSCCCQHHCCATPP